MISPARFNRLQALFFNKITKCCNPSKVKFKFITVASENEFTDFTGDGVRTVGSEIELNCLYDRTLTDKTRENIGVDTDVDTILYISPLELKAVFGESRFPNYVTKSFSQITVEFLNQHHEILNIIELEPMQNGTEVMVLAYQINLKDNSANSDSNLN